MESSYLLALSRETLALNMIVLRQQRKWSQETLALEAGLHRTFIGHVERQARNISLDNIDRIAHAFGLQSWELLRPRQLDGMRTV